MPTYFVKVVCMKINVFVFVCNFYSLAVTALSVVF